jgi:hypothetical protein
VRRLRPALRWEEPQAAAVADDELLVDALGTPVDGGFDDCKLV